MENGLARRSILPTRGNLCTFYLQTAPNHVPPYEIVKFLARGSTILRDLLPPIFPFFFLSFFLFTQLKFSRWSIENDRQEKQEIY